MDTPVFGGARSKVAAQIAEAHIVHQPTPATCNATASVTAADLMKGIITSTSAAAVALSVPTGALCDAGLPVETDFAVDWSVINTGPNTVTVTAATGHTLVGLATVATATVGRFRTRKTAADTFVTYRLS